MQCPLKSGEAAELLVGYGARTLAPETEAAFEQHIESCASCRELAQAQRAVWSALDVWTPVPVSSDFDQRLFERIAADEQRAWWQRLFQANWSWRPAVPVAAACAVLVAAFLLRGPSSNQAPSAPNQPKLQIEQVEHALDDMEMLKQLGVENQAEKSHPSERI